MNIEMVMKELENNNMKPYFVQDRDGVAPLVKTLIQEGQTICRGGSVTLEQCKLTQLLQDPAYTYLDKWDKSLTTEQSEDLQRKAVYSDVMLTSVNAITQEGQLYCVDGSGTRVSLMIFGPKKVIVIAGVNKIVKDLEEAAHRIRTIAAPLNTKRLNCKTYCAASGKCINSDSEEMIPNNANCAHTICCDTVVFSRQRIPNRIVVILVGEELGY